MIKRIEYYSDYRIFLKDFYADRKQRFPYFSNRTFCKKAGIKSPSLLQEVINGKRNLTVKTIPSFIKGLALNETDAELFRLLVHFNQAGEPDEKQHYLEKMCQLTRKVKQNVIPSDQYEYYSKWYNPVIRELACIMDWKEDFTVLAQSVVPAIKKTEAKKSIELLLKLGFLVKSETGRYRQSHPAITTGCEVNTISVRTLNKSMSVLGTEAIERFAPAERDISSLTIGISGKSFQLIKQEIQEFKKRVIRMVDDDITSDRVYTINVQLFPLSVKNDTGTDPKETR
jgi:uncharacterized protein (TIGR02147 family)